MDITNILAGLSAVLDPVALLMMLAGVIVGIIFGAIPGLSATMAVALFLPVTYTLATTQGISLLIGLYIGAISGGLISAILLRIPGTPSSIATCFDGHPMAQRGEAGKALGIGIFYSFLGGLFSFIALLVIAPPLAKIALKFSPFEYFSIAIFSLTLIGSLASKALVKGMISGVLGFMIATIGVAPVDAYPRFTFGLTELSGGIDILPLMIGLFAVAEILSTARKGTGLEGATISNPDMKKLRGFGFSMAEFLSQIPNFIRSFLIGLGIGILPGIGGGTSNLLSYAAAKNSSRHPEKFGTGIIDGVVASETANNASIGGALIPLLTLGIPGDTVTAILLGGLTIKGLTPGPMLFRTNADLIYAVFFACIVANFMMLVVEFGGIRAFIAVLKIDKKILLPVIMVLCVVGAYGTNNRIFDVWAIFLLGLLGFGLSYLDFSLSPMILGFILGPMAEQNLRRGLMFSRGSFLPFITRPVSLIFLLTAAGSIIFTVIKNGREDVNAR